MRRLVIAYILPCHSHTVDMIVHQGWNPIFRRDIGGEDIDFRMLFQKLASEDRKADDKTGWTGIVFEVAASGVFGNKKEVDDTPFWDVLLYLYKCKFEYLHQKRNKK